MSYLGHFLGHYEGSYFGYSDGYGFVVLGGGGDPKKEKLKELKEIVNVVEEVIEEYEKAPDKKYFRRFAAAELRSVGATQRDEISLTDTRRIKAELNREIRRIALQRDDDDFLQVFASIN